MHVFVPRKENVLCALTVICCVMRSTVINLILLFFYSSNTQFLSLHVSPLLPSPSLCSRSLFAVLCATVGFTTRPHLYHNRSLHHGSKPGDYLEHSPARCLRRRFPITHPKLVQWGAKVLIWRCLVSEDWSLLSG